jgi:hypothetical protein
MNHAWGKLNQLVYPLAFSTFLLAFAGTNCRAVNGELQVIELPPLRVNGAPASAHTQGLEVVGGRYYITARREDIRPKRPLLLQFDPNGQSLQVWELDPPIEPGGTATLDHPGGMQFDGNHFWVPIAESRPKSRTIICAFSLGGLKPGALLKPEKAFTFNDHIGALAVLPDRTMIVGANWNTEAVYIWDTKGNLKRTLTPAELEMRGLGASSGKGGVAVQDWKFVEQTLFGCGLIRTPSTPTGSSRSRFVECGNFLEPNVTRRVIELPRPKGAELGREGMAVSGGFVYFLPEDLGTTNRLFRIGLDEVLNGRMTSSRGSRGAESR